MTERLIAGWGVRLVDQPCGCDGRGIRPGGAVCTCDAGRWRAEGARGREEMKEYRERYAKELVEFYGKPVEQLSVWQVMRFVALREDAIQRFGQR